MKKLAFILIFFGLSTAVFSQGVYDDFIYTRQAVTERKVVEWQHLREADVMWARRVWREIDVREKQNQPMNWPKNPLNMIVYNAITTGKLTAYWSDSLSSFMTPEIFKLQGSEEKINKRYIDETLEDPEFADNIAYDTVPEVKKPEDILRYRIMEDWIFDKKESRMYVRIIAIAPMVRKTINGEDVGVVPWAWIKYHKDPSDDDVSDLRGVLVNMEVFNRQNDAARLTYDDWFEQRLFSSFIVKEANPYDMYINQFATFEDDGLAALLESERIKQELFEKEHDLWEY